MTPTITSIPETPAASIAPASPPSTNGTASPGASTPPSATPAPPPEDVAARTAVIRVSLTKPGATRQASKSRVDVVSRKGAEGDPSAEGDPEDASTRVSLALLRHPRFRAITKHDGRVRSTMRAATLASGSLPAGAYLVPLREVERLFGTLDTLRAKREALVGALVQDYPDVVRDARERLRDAFDPASLPGVSLGPVEIPGDVRPLVIDPRAGEAVRALFSFTWELEVSSRTAGVQAAREGLSEAFVKRELDKARQAGEAMVNDIRDGLRVAFAGLVSRAREMLGGKGERRAFRGEHLKHIREFIDAFASRNVTGDDELQRVVKQAQGVLAGVTDDELREAREGELRPQIAAAFASVESWLAPLVASAPKRRITLDGEST